MSRREVMRELATSFVERVDNTIACFGLEVWVPKCIKSLVCGQVPMDIHRMSPMVM